MGYPNCGEKIVEFHGERFWEKIVHVPFEGGRQIAVAMLDDQPVSVFVDDDGFFKLKRGGAGG